MDFGFGYDFFLQEFWLNNMRHEKVSAFPFHNIYLYVNGNHNHNNNVLNAF